MPNPTEKKPWHPNVTMVEISDDFGNKLSVPSLGSWTLNEAAALEACRLRYEQESIDHNQYVIECIQEMFRLRGIPIKEHVGDLRDVPAELLGKVWNFFQTETDWLKNQHEEEEKTGKKPTGKKSTGKSKEPTQTTKDLAA